MRRMVKMKAPILTLTGTMIWIIFTTEATNNIALNKMAYQTDTNNGAVPGLTVDGGLSQNFLDGSCSATISNDASWEVDLGANYTISQVKIYNEQNCCFLDEVFWKLLLKMVSAVTEQLIIKYHQYGYSHRLIHYLLERIHNVAISYSYLVRKVIPSLGLARRGRMQVDFDEIIKQSRNEIDNGIAGSEQLRKILAMKHGIRITRQFSREIVGLFDPEGVKRRQRKRLRRRQYINRGPNFVWHLDGYDKLTQFGICIHGCVDGFSRKVLWLEAGITNKRPDVIASYYLNAVEREGGYPCKVRADHGTENVVVATMHRTLSGNENSFIYGRSTSNQRIERWWGYLRQSRTDFWIDHFKNLESTGLFVKEDPIHRLCLQYSYLPFVKMQLKEVSLIWNTHYIRRQKVGDVVPGIPSVLHSNPEIIGVQTFLNEDIADIQQLKNICSNNYLKLDEDFVRVACSIVQSLNLPSPEYLSSISDAKNMYIVLKEAFEALF